jgi:hypothetical protein
MVPAGGQGCPRWQIGNPYSTVEDLIRPEGISNANRVVVRLHSARCDRFLDARTSTTGERSGDEKHTN